MGDPNNDAQHDIEPVELRVGDCIPGLSLVQDINWEGDFRTFRLSADYINMEKGTPVYTDSTREIIYRDYINPETNQQETAGPSELLSLAIFRILNKTPEAHASVLAALYNVIGQPDKKILWICGENVLRELEKITQGFNLEEYSLVLVEGDNMGRERKIYSILKRFPLPVLAVIGKSDPVDERVPDKKTIFKR